MDVKTINSVSLQQSFEGRSKRKENKDFAEYPQMDRPASKKASKAMRDMAMGLMLLGATAGGVSSCVKTEAWSDSNAWAWVIDDCGCNKPDTIFKPTPIREVDWAVNDSIKNQFINIGSEVDGPVEGDNVLLVSGKFRNKYDNKVVEFQVDSTGCNKHQMMYVAKVTDLYDPNNPKKEWWQVKAKDVPGRGIKYTFSTTNSKVKPEPWQYDEKYAIIVSNGARGGKPGINTIYDKDGQMIWQGQLEKGQQTGSFVYGVLALDENDEVYINPDTGKPEMDNFDYDDCKISTRKANFQKFEQPVNPNDYDFDL